MSRNIKFSLLALVFFLSGCAGGNLYYNHGTDLLNNRDYNKAIPYFLESIRIDPNFAPAYVNLGNAYLALRLPKAPDLYKEAIRLKPDFALAHYNLGNYYENIGAFDLAIVSYKEAIRYGVREPEFSRIKSFIDYNK